MTASRACIERAQTVIAAQCVLDIGREKWLPEKGRAERAAASAASSADVIMTTLTGYFSRLNSASVSRPLKSGML